MDKPLHRPLRLLAHALRDRARGPGTRMARRRLLRRWMRQGGGMRADVAER
jgi:hypothetical protein